MLRSISISIYFDVTQLCSQNYPQYLVKLSVRYLYSVLVRSFFDLFGVRGVNVCGFRPFVFRVLSLLRSDGFSSFDFDFNFNTNTDRATYLLTHSTPDGLDVVDAIEAVGSQSGATSKTVVVKASGELTE